MERTLTAREYFMHLKQADPTRATVSKTLTCFTWGATYWELNSFRGASYVAVLEVEAESMDAEVRIPHFVDVLREVTEEQSYDSYLLASELQKKARRRRRRRHSHAPAPCDPYLTLPYLTLTLPYLTLTLPYLTLPYARRWRRPSSPTSAGRIGWRRKSQRSSPLWSGRPPGMPPPPWGWRPPRSDSRASSLRLRPRASPRGRHPARWGAGARRLTPHQEETRGWNACAGSMSREERSVFCQTRQTQTKRARPPPPDKLYACPSMHALASCVLRALRRGTRPRYNIGYTNTIQRKVQSGENPIAKCNRRVECNPAIFIASLLRLLV